MPFDVRAVFRTFSDTMRAEFDRSAHIPHSTGMGSMREEIVRRFLREYLPSRYAVGQGQIIVATNHTSKQMDVVIFDHANCPRLLVNPEHSIFPLESVYGVVSVKSILNSSELAEAFENVVTAKRLAQEKTVVIKQQRFQFGLANPTPVGVVFAFDADRSLDAIAKQARTLQEALAKPQHAPDLIVVLGKGLVGPRERTRDELNAVKLPKENNRMVVREVRQHTLLRFYLQLLNELNTITLAPLMLDDYLQMPELVDGHRVSGHGPFFQRAEGEPVPGVPPPLKKLSRDFLLKIIEATREVTPITYADHLRHSVGNVDLSLMPADWLKTTVIEYNPLNSPSMTDVGLDFTTANTAKPAYSPLHIKIDDQNVAVDGNSIGTDDLETSDVEFDEIFDSRPLHGKKRDE